MSAELLQKYRDTYTEDYVRKKMKQYYGVQDIADENMQDSMRLIMHTEIKKDGTKRNRKELRKFLRTRK